MEKDREIKPDLDRLIELWSKGDEQALHQIMPMVYETLHTIAQSRFVDERAGHTLQPTILINELYLRLSGDGKMDLHNKNQFFAAASTIMRNILIDNARKHRAAKRGNEQKVHLTSGLEEKSDPSKLDPEEILGIDEALGKLRKLDPQQAQIVDLKFFVGLTNEEVAEIIGKAERTVRREWNAAKAYLKKELQKQTAAGVR